MESTSSAREPDTVNDSSAAAVAVASASVERARSSMESSSSAREPDTVNESAAAAVAAASASVDRGGSWFLSEPAGRGIALCEEKERVVGQREKKQQRRRNVDWGWKNQQRTVKKAQRRLGSGK